MIINTNNIDNNGCIKDIIKTGTNTAKNRISDSSVLLKLYFNNKDAHESKRISKNKKNKVPDKLTFFIEQTNSNGIYKMKLLYKMFPNLILTNCLIFIKLAV